MRPLLTLHRLVPAGLTLSMVLIQALPALAKPLLKGGRGSWSVSEFIATSPQQAWSLLSNYSLLAQLAPDIREARVVRRQGNSVELEQTYQAGYTFGLPIRTRLKISETPNRGFSYGLIQGERLNSLQGSWTITAVPGGIQLRHQMQVDPQVPTALRPIYDHQQEATLVQWLTILKNRLEEGARR